MKCDNEKRTQALHVMRKDGLLPQSGDRTGWAEPSN